MGGTPLPSKSHLERSLWRRVLVPVHCRSETVSRKGCRLNSSCLWDGLCVEVVPASLVHSILVTSTGPLSVAVTTHLRQAWSEAGDSLWGPHVSQQVLYYHSVKTPHFCLISASLLSGQGPAMFPSTGSRGVVLCGHIHMEVRGQLSKTPSTTQILVNSRQVW